METTLRTKRVSQIKEDILVLAAVWGPSPQQRYFTHTVRGVPVQVLTISKLDERNVSYRQVVFPGHHVQWVNEGNIRSRKIKPMGVIVDEPTKKAA